MLQAYNLTHETVNCDSAHLQHADLTDKEREFQVWEEGMKECRVHSQAPPGMTSRWIWLVQWCAAVACCWQAHDVLPLGVHLIRTTEDM